ncbi:MAG: diaminopimelate epimerase [Promethearchaeota archaeon]
MRDLEFSKVHGLGNDFIVVDDTGGVVPDDFKGKLALELCRPHFSVGADGIIYICPPTSEDFDVRFRIFNSDGTEAEMCGNGIRCFAKLAYERGIVEKTEMRVETLAGLVVPELNVVDGVVGTVTVDMGEYVVDPALVPVNPPDPSAGAFIDEPVEVGDRTFNVTAVSMGNPHAVVFLDGDVELEGEAGTKFVENYGSILERDTTLFPKKVNVEFVKWLSPVEARMRVFERGVGITLACGTGSCATVVAGTLLGKFNRGDPVTVHLDGGDLRVTVDGKRVHMEGPAVEVFTGRIKDLEVQ